MKKGLIKISNIIYEKDWQTIYIIFKDFKPFQINNDTYEWNFYGESEFFDEIKDGDLIPQYDVLFTSHLDGTYTYKFEKVKDIINEPGS